MTTEILGFTIIVGAILVLLARQQLHKAEDDPEVLEAATGRLRYELEQAADEIIGRMTEHVDQLEKMLREADYKSELLQQRIDYLERLLAGNAMPLQASSQSGEKYREPDDSLADLLGSSELAAVYTPRRENIGQPVPAPAAGNLMNQPTDSSRADTASPQMSSADEKAWEYIREASMKLEAQYEAQSNTMQSVQQSDALQQAVDLQTGNIDNLVSGSGYSSHDLGISAGETESSPAAQEQQGIDTEAATRQAREMLSAGYELEEIARITGLGIGAVSLIRQMVARM